MTTLKFNNKSFDYEKLYKAPTRGVNADLDVSDAIVKHTRNNLSISGERLVESNVVFYLFEGLPIILMGLSLYKKALADGVVKIKAWMFTKHSLSVFEMNSKFIITINEPRNSAPSFNNNPNWRQSRNDNYEISDYAQAPKPTHTFRNKPAVPSKAFVKRTPKKY